MGPLQLEVLSCLWTLEEAAATGDPPARPSSFWATPYEIWTAFNDARMKRDQSTLTYATIWQILKRQHKKGLLESQPVYRPGAAPVEQRKKTGSPTPRWVVIQRDDLESPLPDEGHEQPPAAISPADVRTWQYRTVQTRKQLLAAKIRELRKELIVLQTGIRDPVHAALEIAHAQETNPRAKKVLGLCLLLESAQDPFARALEALCCHEGTPRAMKVLEIIRQPFFTKGL